MRTTKIETVPAKTREVTDYIQCDLCQARTERHRGDGGNWGKDSYDVVETEVSMKVGTVFPEGGSITTTIIDICPGCFKNKLLPWVRLQGGESRETESDW